MCRKLYSSYFIAILMIIIGLGFSCNQVSQKQLPVYNPIDVNPLLVDKSKQNVDENHTIANFSLTNQNGEVITQEDYRNKVYVADFIFTRCPSICPIMTNNMAKIQNIFKENDDIKFLSMSVTPVIDSVSVLRDYANRNDVIDTKWNITTGSKKHIYELARKSFFAVVDQGDGGLQDFIHTETFILVDTKKQIRGFYDGTNDEDVKRLVREINVLIDETNN